MKAPWLCLHCHTALTDAAARTHACGPASLQDGPAGIVRGPVPDAEERK